MDLVIQNKQKRMHYILPLTLLMTTMIFYYSKIQGTSLPFTLPLFIVAFGSGTFYFIGYLSIISFLSILEINIAPCQSAQLRDTQACFQQDKHIIMILLIGSVLLHEV